MTPEQLNSARMARWSQNGEARLTIEAIAEWLETVGFCPVLPGAQAAPSPSLVEAVVGRPAQLPSAGERARAQELLVRLVQSSAAVPLKLGASLGEQPDFLVSLPVLPYVYALLGDRNFKNGPSTAGPAKVTPLAQHCWQAMEQKGPMDLTTLQQSIGGDITEAAIARALQELWVGLYVVPVLGAPGQAARWELMAQRYPEQVAAGSRTGHAEAQSALVTLYLHAAVAAAEDEVLEFLAPLASKSKLREVIRGLAAMRQLDMVDVAGRPHLCLQGGLLPEMAQQLSEEQLAASRPAPPELEIQKLEAAEDKPRTTWQPRSPAAARPVREAGFARRPKPASSSGYVSGERSRGYSANRGDRSARPSRPDSYSRRSAPSATGDSRHPRASARGSFPAAGGASPQDRPKRWEKPGAPAGKGSGASRASGFKPAGDKPWRPRTSSASRPWQQRESPSAESAKRGAGPRRQHDSGYQQAEHPRRPPAKGEDRPRRWDKAGAGDTRRPYAQRTSGAKPWVAKSKPWIAKSRDARPWDQRGPSGDQPKPDRGAGERARRWEKSGDLEGGDNRQSRSFSPRKRDASPAAANRPYRPRSTGAASSGSKSSASRAAGTRSKTFAAKASSAKPWARRSSPEGGFDPESASKARRPARGAEPDSRADRKARTKSRAGSGADARPTASKPPSGAKPFWTKNPRGGKGSTAASRSNRPRGKKK